MIVRSAAKATLLATSLMIFAACAEKVAQPPAPPPMPAPTPVRSGTISQETVKATAKVDKINYKTRMITLRRSDGTRVTIHAGDQVQRLNEIKKGDTVVTEYYQSLAYKLVKPGEAAEGSMVVAGGVERAEDNQPPGVAGVAVATVVAKITAINRETSTVTLSDGKGAPQEVKVRDPRRLEAAKVGDKVELTYTEALAISIEKAPKTPKKK